jgi:beta-glucosidase
LRSLTAGRWTRIAVPLACFAHAGAELSRVTGLFELSAATALDFSVSRVALGGDFDQQVSCPGN